MNNFVALYLIYGDPSYKTRGALYIAFFNLILVMFFWSFFTAMLTDPGLPSNIPDLVVNVK